MKGIGMGKRDGVWDGGGMGLGSVAFAGDMPTRVAGNFGGEDTPSRGNGRRRGGLMERGGGVGKRWDRGCGASTACCGRGFPT